MTFLFNFQPVHKFHFLSTQIANFASGLSVVYLCVEDPAVTHQPCQYTVQQNNIYTVQILCVLFVHTLHLSRMYIVQFVLTTYIYYRAYVFCLYIHISSQYTVQFSMSLPLTYNICVLFVHTLHLHLFSVKIQNMCLVCRPTYIFLALIYTCILITHKTCVQQAHQIDVLVSTYKIFVQQIHSLHDMYVKILFVGMLRVFQNFIFRLKYFKMTTPRLI